MLQLTFHARIDWTCFFVAIFVAVSVTPTILGGKSVATESMICLLFVFLEARQPKLLMHLCALECQLMLVSLSTISPKH